MTAGEKPSHENMSNSGGPRSLGGQHQREGAGIRESAYDVQNRGESVLEGRNSKKRKEE